MKKFTIFAVVIAMITSFSGCGGNTEAAKVETTEAVIETTVETTEATAEETTEPTETEETIGEFYWPTFGIVERLPEVEWSNRGVIYVDSPDAFYCDIYETGLKEFSEYISKCQELGYTIDYYSIPGSVYCAENDDGYSLTLTYDEDDDYMSIALYLYPES